MDMALKFITALAWIVGPIGTILICSAPSRKREWQCLPILLILCADAWLLARYLL